MMIAAKQMIISAEGHLSGEQDTWQQAETAAGPGRRAGSRADGERGDGGGH